MPLARRDVTFALAGLAAALPAQVPGHAVLLNPSGARLSPLLARTGDTVHGVGHRAHLLGMGFIDYFRSADGGRTWPVREVAIGYATHLGGIAAEGDLVVVLIQSPWLGPYTITSTDRGLSWAQPVRVSQAPLPASQMITAALHLSGSTVNVAWFENRASGGFVWTNRSLDSGFTWQANDTRLDVGVLSNGNVQTMKLLAEGPILHLFWNNPTGTVWLTLHQRSLDGGATWLAAPQVAWNGPAQSFGGDANTLFVVPQQAPALRSVDAGQTWTQVTGMGLQPLDLAADGARVLAVGQAGGVPTVTIQLNMSQDRGVTWLPAPYTITQARSFVSPKARLAGDAAFVQFPFGANDAPTGVVVQSDDGGVHWRLVHGEAGDGLLVSADGTLVTTRQAGSGEALYAYVQEGHTSLGQGSPGTGGVVPLLQGTGLPGLGRTFALDVDGARGGSPGAWFATFGATANVPLGSATLYLQQPIGPFGFTTSGVPGAAGAGTASLPIAVPASPSFAGLRLASQAFVLDPVAAGGFTATRAVETWIR